MIMDIILDCDPGQDDALAILLALGSKNINLKAITVVGGNADVDKCYLNAIKVLALANRMDIPVYKGVKKPLKQDLITLENVFGECGMAGTDNWETPKFTIPQKTAVDFLVDAYSHGEIYPHLVAIAPQTNIALAIQKQPAIAKSIPNLTAMGGCIFPEPIHGRMGNITFDGGRSYAEYNFATDPEAVDIVLRSGIKEINLVGLEVTRTVLYNHEIDVQIRKIGSSQATAVADMLSTLGEDDIQDYAYLKKDQTDPVRAVHDAVAVCYLENPSIFSVEKMPLRIDLEDKRGQTILDHSGIIVNVIKDVDKKAFFNIVCESIANLK